MEIDFKPSKPGYSNQEALELLGMCVVANYLGPVVFAPFPRGLVPTSDRGNPLPADDGKTYPYPLNPIWPKGWTPAVPSPDPSKPWQNSILISRLSNGLGVDAAIFAYNAQNDAYAISFAGTLNPGAAMQDMCAILVPAGPVNLSYFQSAENYVFPIPPLTFAAAGGPATPPVTQPPRQEPRVHLGYRQAVESLTVGPEPLANLKSLLAGLEREEIDLYVTGHSLGAALAQLFSAWIKTGGVPSKKINVKCYSFATPKSANSPMVFNYDSALSNGGWSYRVENCLDTASQLPPTKEANTDLLNPYIADDVSNKADPTGPYSSSPLAPLIEMIKQSGSKPSTPAETVPFPFSLAGELVKTIAACEVAISAALIDRFQGCTATQPPDSPSPPSPQPAQEPLSFDYVAMGVAHSLTAREPVVYNGKCYPPEFFPNREPNDLVDIPDIDTREWWQHWPFTYALYLKQERSAESLVG